MNRTVVKQPFAHDTTTMSDPNPYDELSSPEDSNSGDYGVLHDANGAAGPVPQEDRLYETLDGSQSTGVYTYLSNAAAGQKVVMKKETVSCDFETGLTDCHWENCKGCVQWQRLSGNGHNNTGTGHEHDDNNNSFQNIDAEINDPDNLQNTNNDINNSDNKDIDNVIHIDHNVTSANDYHGRLHNIDFTRYKSRADV
nr:hypothetical protein BaRGS_017071 [Batillaria attramentaria]